MNKQKESFYEKVRSLILRLVQFVTVDVWKRKSFIGGVIIAIWVSIQNFNDKDLRKKATALSFNTLLALVPMLAVVLAIARGFGFQSTVENLLVETASNNNMEVMDAVFGYVNSYMEKARGGVFMGVGIVILFVSVVNVLRSLEEVFNKDIWYVGKSRNIVRQFVDYISVIVIVPILMVVMSGFSVYVSSAFSATELGGYFSPVISVWMKVLPFVVVCALFTIIYITVPNTKVKFVPALIAGVVAGSAFQFFQLLYINGQIWVSSYNAIYGSFAALPLLMLWLQLSFSILLYGATLSFSCQNIKNYILKKELEHISPYFKNFMCLVILNVIAKRFEKMETPVSLTEIASENQIPYQLVARLTAELEHNGILAKKETDDEEVVYIPAFDIDKLTVAEVYERMQKDGAGFDDFQFDGDAHFENIKKKNEELYDKYIHLTADILVKDL